VLLLAAAPMLVAVAALVARAPEVVDGEVLTESWTWVEGLGLTVDLRLDGFGLLMALLVSGIGLLVAVYAVGYFGHHASGLGRLSGPLVLFAGAMLGLVLADHLLVLYVCWELTSVTSYLLIGWDDRNASSRGAALQAIIVTGAGGLCLLGGLVLLGQSAGTYRLSELLADPPSGTTVSVALVLVLLGALTKSAQVPFSFWLPGAMAAPTPISAYLHSATMVKAGVYLVARLAPAFADVGVWRPVVVVVGLATMLVGGLRALVQHDLKLLLAHGTVSQLGFLVVLFGIGLPEATAAGVALLLAHALFKAALFMVVGIVDHQAHTRDLRALRGLGPGWWPVLGVAVASAASMAAVPLLFGFIAKEKAYDALLHGPGWAGVTLVVVVAGSVLTVGYSARFVWGLLATDKPAVPDVPGSSAPVTSAPPPPTGFALPAQVLTVPTVVLGVLPFLADGIVGAAAAALDPAVGDVHLKLWHGLNAALALSALTLGLGATVFLVGGRLAETAARLPLLAPSSVGFARSLRALNRVADRTTSVVQSGSLPAYLGIIVLVVALVPALAFAADPSWSGWPPLVDRPAHLAVSVLVVAGAAAAAALRRRFAAVLALGVVGYAMALLFVVEGAPDLALTQFAIETLSVVLFVLVLRFLPDRFEPSRLPRRRAVRLGVAAVVGVTVTAATLVATGSRTSEPIAAGFVERSVPEGGGRNVVNVILVDFRALDTMGEITVLLVAAVGSLTLAGSAATYLRRREPGGGRARLAPSTRAEDQP
jgi:multicomponent Na+:H+ antiporter subunit A